MQEIKYHATTQTHTLKLNYNKQQINHLFLASYAIILYVYKICISLSTLFITPC